MQGLKKILGYLCIFVCIFYAIVMPQMAPDVKWSIPAACVIFAMFAYYLLKKTPNKVSPIRIYLGVECFGGCILSLCLIFNPLAEQVPITTLLLCAMIFGILSFWLLHGFKRRQPTENQTEPKVNDIKLDQIAKPLAEVEESTEIIENINNKSPFYIKPNVYPVTPGYDQLDDNEYIFFSEFSKALSAENIPTSQVTLTRLSSGIFNLNCPNAYLGKVDVKTNRRKPLYIQYFETSGELKELHTESLRECIEVIPSIIKYVKLFQQLSVNVTSSSVPQETLNAMQEAYSPMQADNDMRILQDSIQILQKTTNLETFFSRYEIAMEKALTLKQAKQAGIPINLNVSSQAITAYKHQRLAQLLPIIYKKEIQSIDELKTIKGKLNRLDKFSELLNKYALELEFVPGYDEIINNIATIKQNLN